MTSTLLSKNDKNSDNAFYSKKGEPMYQEDMDADRDGVVTFEEFKAYCKANNISAKDMSDMIEMRTAYRMSQDTIEQAKSAKTKEPSVGSLDLIYAKDGDKNYNADIDTNKDSIVSYNEYLRYCEENARMEAKNSDTKIVEDNKNKFTTVSFGHASNAYYKAQGISPEGKVESKI